MHPRTECTVFRHAWFMVDGDWTPPFDGNVVTCRCERCGSERREIWQRNTGALLYRRYVRTEGWVEFPKGERPSMDESRLDWITSAITEARKARRKSNGRSHLHGVQGGRVSNGK